MDQLQVVWRAAHSHALRACAVLWCMEGMCVWGAVPDLFFFVLLCEGVVL
jgi:hypothetical protein